jgi:hypothetical protein
VSEWSQQIDAPADEIEAAEVAGNDDATPGGAVDPTEVELAPSAEESAMHVEEES